MEDRKIRYKYASELINVPIYAQAPVWISYIWEIVSDTRRLSFGDCIHLALWNKLKKKELIGVYVVIQCIFRTLYLLVGTA